MVILRNVVTGRISWMVVMFFYLMLVIQLCVAQETHQDSTCMIYMYPLCVYIISPDQCIVSVLTYPIDIGRNIAEILRIVSALQESQNDDCLMPANWIPGCDTFSRSSNSYIELMDKLRGSTNWYFDPKRLI